MNIQDIYLGPALSFKVIKTLKRKIVKLESTSNRSSIFYKNNGRYEDILTNKVLDNPEHIIIKGIILGNANKIDENKEYVLAEYLFSFKEYIELFGLDKKDELTKEEVFEIIKQDDFLTKIYKKGSKK